MASKKLFKKIAIGLTVFFVAQNILTGIVPALAPHIASAESTPLVNNVQITNDEARKDSFSNLAQCNLTTADFSGCLVQAIYTIIYEPVHWVTGIAGRFADIFISYSINNESYRQNEFIEKGWGVVRDITNIFFIFALLLIAFNYVLGQSFGGNPKSVLVKVITAGLLINFSLFFSQVIIDGGNIMATVFYNHIHVVDGNGQEVLGEHGERSVSLAIINKSDPQIMFDQFSERSTSPALLALIILAATAFNVALIVLFFSVAYLFIGRVVGLMIQMIFSPLAFASPIIPIKGAVGEFDFGKWLSTILSVSFMAPVFLFFLYLVTLFQDAQNQLGFNNPTDTITKIISVLLPFAITFVLVMKAKDTAKSMAGTVANQLSGILTKATGMLAGAALTVGSAGLTAGVGAAGAGLAAKTAGSTNVFARGLNAVGKKAATTNFDFRSSRLGKFAQTGIKQAGGKLNLGTPSKTYQGGYQGMQQNAIAAQIKKAEEFAKISPNDKVFREFRDAQNKLENTNKGAGMTEIQKTQYNDAKKSMEEKEKDLEDIKKVGTKEEIATAKMELKIARNALAETDQQKAINQAKKDTDAAEKAIGKKQKERKNKYAEALEKNGLIGTTASLSMSNNSLEDAIRQIKGKPEANVIVKVNIKNENTGDGGGTGTGKKKKTSSSYSQTNVNAQNIPTGNQQPPITDKFGNPISSQTQNQNTNTNTGTNINNNPPSGNQNNNNNNGGSNNNYQGGINNTNGPVNPPPPPTQ